MPNFNVTAPNGLTFNVAGPDNGTPDDAIQYAQRLYQNLDVRPEHIQEVETGSFADPKAAVNAKSGARGRMQVRPSVAAQPGFGVAPAKNESEAEYTRVGKDLYNAFKTKYKDPFVAAVAYNWGPTHADKWLENGADWRKLPKETYQYVQKLFNVAMKRSKVASND